jgi:hypothetical protein
MENKDRSTGISRSCLEINLADLLVQQRDYTLFHACAGKEDVQILWQNRQSCLGERDLRFKSLSRLKKKGYQKPFRSLPGC